MNDGTRYGVEPSDVQMGKTSTRVYFILDLVTGDRVGEPGNTCMVLTYTSLTEAWQYCSVLNQGATAEALPAP